MQKITFFSTRPSVGGSEKVLINIANEFAQMGIPVEFIFCYSNGSLRDDIHPAIKVFGLESRVRWALLKFYRVVLKTKPNIIISGPQSTNFISIIVSKLPYTKYKTIATHHNFHNSEIRKSFLGKFNPLFIKLLYNVSDKVVSVSNEIKQHLINDCKVGENKIEVINNPVANQKIVLQSKEDVTEFPFTEKRPIIISIGRLAKIKNFQLMLESFNLLLKKISAYLVIIGEGEEKAFIQEKIEELNIEGKVILLGAQSNPYKYISKSKLLFHTSVSESFGMVIAEAFALGVPVVSSSTEGAKEITDNGKYAVLFTEQNTEMIASMLFSLLNGELEFNKSDLIKRGFFYSSEKTAKEYLDIINELRS